MVAKKTLIQLPEKAQLKKLCQSLAMLDAIAESEWDYRYSSFDARWNANEMLATARNGGGDEYFVFLNKHGVIIKGFDHESEMSPCGNPEEIWKGVLDEVPKEFESFLEDEAFPNEDTTFCLWRLDSEGAWKTGTIKYPDEDETADGSDWLLFLLDGKPETYLDWAQGYYERDFDIEAIEKIYRHEPLTEIIVKNLNPKCDLVDLISDAEEIDYPRS